MDVGTVHLLIALSFTKIVSSVMVLPFIIRGEWVESVGLRKMR